VALVTNLRLFFRDFGFKVIRLKYFIIIVGALLLEILTLTLYLLKLQNIVDFDLFSLAILYGAISGIIVILAVAILFLMKADRKKDSENIKIFQAYQKTYKMLSSKYLNSINGLLRSFENEVSDLDTKLGYAEALEKKYSQYLEEFSSLDVPDFLAPAHKYECGHLAREKDIYNELANLTEASRLKSISNESDILHDNFLRETHRIEKSLKLII
jgi:hypothetical protein